MGWRKPFCEKKKEKKEEYILALFVSTFLDFFCFFKEKKSVLMWHKNNNSFKCFVSVMSLGIP